MTIDKLNESKKIIDKIKGLEIILNEIREEYWFPSIFNIKKRKRYIKGLQEILNDYLDDEHINKICDFIEATTKEQKEIYEKLFEEL